jgi:hypothetical protein
MYAKRRAPYTNVFKARIAVVDDLKGDKLMFPSGNVNADRRANAIVATDSPYPEEEMNGVLVVVFTINRQW